MAAGGAPTTIEELRKRAQADGIEFLFAQFVDMHGKPNAKLVPVAAPRRLLTEGAGFAGFAAGPMGQTPASPDVAADARPRVVHARCRSSPASRASPATSRSRASPGRTARARSCATPSTRAAELGYRLKMGIELEFFLVKEATARSCCSTTSTRSSSPATT